MQWSHILKTVCLCIGMAICKEMSLDIVPFKYIQPLQCGIVFLHYLNFPHIMMTFYLENRHNWNYQCNIHLLIILHKYHVLHHIHIVLKTIWHTWWGKKTEFGGMQSKDVFSTLLLTGHLVLNNSLIFNFAIFLFIKGSEVVITPTPRL